MVNKSKLNNIFSYMIDKNNCAPCRLKEIEKKKSDGKKSKMVERKRESFKTCYSKESLIKIAKALNEHKGGGKKPIVIANRSKKSLWEQIQKRFSTACENDEHCWKKQDLVKKLNDIDIQMYTFKPEYPKSWLKNKYTWLNTYDIYYVMKQYEKANDDFMFMGPIPADCPTKIHCELSKLNLIDLKKNGINKIGIIYNLDTSDQPGSHWTAVYIDNKNNEINYYDSYGTKSTNLITEFIKKVSKSYLQNNIKPTIIYNDKRHQYGGSECGMFSMNFILERLHGKTMYDISNMRIPDEKMNYLRKLLYNYKKNSNNDG